MAFDFAGEKRRGSVDLNPRAAVLRLNYLSWLGRRDVSSWLPKPKNHHPRVSPHEGEPPHKGMVEAVQAPCPTPSSCRAPERRREKDDEVKVLCLDSAEIAVRKLQITHQQRMLVCRSIRWSEPSVEVNGRVVSQRLEKQRFATFFERP